MCLDTQRAICIRFPFLRRDQKPFGIPWHFTVNRHIMSGYPSSISVDSGYKLLFYSPILCWGTLRIATLSFKLFTHSHLILSPSKDINKTYHILSFLNTI